MPTTEKIVVIGACGQLGTELTLELRRIYGASNVIATDVAIPKQDFKDSGPFVNLNVLDRYGLFELLQEEKVSQVYHLAALLSATSETNPSLAWNLNVNGLMNVLDAAKAYPQIIKKIYVPSSIAVFGPHTPKENTPQQTVTDPTTVYGITKLVGERLGEYYFQKWKVDVRSLRYPGLISYKTPPGGGTTDYAVDIYHQALKQKSYTCYLEKDTALPMMYMPDALRATLELMDAPAEQVKVRSSYNLTAMRLTPEEMAASIRGFIPEFTIDFQPDFRQKIADSWPSSLDDSEATKDWNWKPEYGLDAMTKDMLEQLKPRYA